MSNEIFGKVFLGGSKRIGRVPENVVAYLDSFIESGEHFLIGDCHGADLALQNYLHSKNYEKVTVFCSGEKCRFNVGGWEVRHIEASEELDGIEFYRKKDKVMIAECDCGFFVWDTHSIGTRLNRMDLKRLGKPIFTYRSTTDEFKITRRKEVAQGLSESLIETLMDVAEDNIDAAIICNNEAELHAAIESMSIIEEEEK